MALWYAGLEPKERTTLAAFAIVLPLLVGSVGVRGAPVLFHRRDTPGRVTGRAYVGAGVAFGGLVGGFAWLATKGDGLAKAFSWPLGAAGIFVYGLYAVTWISAFVFLAYGITMDTRQRKGELAAAEDQNLVLRKRASELETYTQVLTHDLKTPLIALDWLTQDLESELRSADPKALEATLGRIRKNVGGMDRMVKELLQMSAVENEGIAGHEEVELAAVAHAVVDELDDARRRAGTEIQVHEESLQSILGEPGRVHQAIRNLVGNAIKYGGSRVQVHGRTTGGSPAGTKYELYVDDDGPGVPPEMRERVFELFDRGTAGAETEGTGLGLALVKRIVESHEGTIRVEDAPGGGARFVLSFPADRIAA